jgi:hypothetical protein
MFEIWSSYDDAHEDCWLLGSNCICSERCASSLQDFFSQKGVIVKFINFYRALVKGREGP